MLSPNSYEDLTLEDLDSMIDEITAGIMYIKVQDSKGAQLTFLLEHPHYLDKIKAKKVYDEALIEARSFGLMLYEDLDQIAEKRGFFTEKDRSRVDELSRLIRGQKKLLPRYTVVPDKKKNIHININKMLDEIRELEFKRDKLVPLTDEYKAREAQLEYLSVKCTKNFDTGEFYWPNLQAFKTDKDFVLVRSVLAEVSVFTRGKPVSLVRYIARNPIWRLRFSPIYKMGGKLFSRDQYDYSIDMMSLCYWSLFYQSVYELMPDDMPTDAVMSDDDALDAYLEDLHNEKSRQRTSHALKSGKGTKSAYDHQEVIVTRADPSYMDTSYSDSRPSQKSKDGKTNLSEKELARQSKERLRKRRIGSPPERIS